MRRGWPNNGMSWDEWHAYERRRANIVASPDNLHVDGVTLGQMDIPIMCRQVLEKIRPRDREVLRLMFGLSGKPDMNMLEVAEHLHITAPRVAQIRDRAFRRARAIVRDNG